MARDEQSNGNGNGSSGKSGRQDSSLSARRARLRSLAKQALPPDPYSKKQEGNPNDALELEFLDKSQEEGAQAQPSQPAQEPSAEPWLDEAMKSITNQDPNAAQQPPAADYGQQPDYGQPPISPITPPDPQSMIAQPIADPGLGFSFSNPTFPPDPTQYGAGNQMPPEPGFGQAPPSFESFMQGPAEPPTGFISSPPVLSQEGAPSPFPMGSPAPEPSFGQAPFAFSQQPLPQSQAVEQSYLQHSSSGSDFTSKLDLDYGDLDEPEPAPREPDQQPAPTPEPPPPATADDINRAWETAKPAKKENAWSVGAEDEEQQPEPIAEAPAEAPVEAPVEAPIEEPPSEAETQTEEIREEKVEEPAKAEPAPRKRSRRKSDPDEIEKESESKTQEEESPPEEKSKSSWPEPAQEDEPAAEVSEKKAVSEPTSKKKMEEDSSSNEEMSSKSESKSHDAPNAVQSNVVPVELLTKSQAEALELLTSIDQALGICAMNLSSLQTAATEQTDVLRNLRETLQNQTFFELGLNLNTLMESMSAALEPMKAVGELVPAIDQLVSAMVQKDEKEKETRLSPDKLVMGLADQLSNNQIDPWTFKCAYMAIYPDEHPADLLHRLVELLGTQRVSGEMFRAAYDAVQAADPPRLSAAGEPIVKEVIVEVVKEVEVVKVVPDEEVVRQLEDLRRANEDLRSMLDDKDSDLGKRFEEREREFGDRLQERESELTRKLQERETELTELLSAKENEIQETQEMLHSRFEEFNSRYEEMVETVNQRDEELKIKDDEIVRKESEVTQLKAQLDELKESFKETVDNLQKQLSSTQKAVQEATSQAKAQMPPMPDEKPKPAGSFFDNDSSKAGGGGGGGGFMDSGAQSRPLFQQQMDTFNSMSKGNPQPENKPAAAFSPPTPGAPSAPPEGLKPIQSTTGGFGGASPPTGPIPEPSTQAVPKPVQTTPGMNMAGTGSYGSGVRAQVFEVIVRQALAGAPWREICAGPMSVNNISPDEVEAEVKRREALLKK